ETVSVSKTAIHQSDAIHWKQLWSLASLYASIIIGWIAYQNYQPKLLIQFGFTDFAFFLAVSQAIILVVTPPIAGKMGDRYRFEKGHRLPVISSGISFAAMVFMAVAFTLFSNPGEIFKWALPVMIVLWLVAMSIFTSPALSTVELFTPVDKLPKAMALLTIVANLVYAVEPVIVDIIDYLGAPVTFVVGGVVTLASGYAMKKNSLGLFKQTGDKEVAPDKNKSKTTISSYAFILMLGIILGIGTTVMFNIFPDVLTNKLASITAGTDGKFILVGILVVSAVISWPISTYINKYSMDNVFWTSAGLMALSIGGIFMFDVAWVVLGLVALFTVMITALSVSSLPLAINRAGFYDKVLCVGVFFSGVALPEGIFESLQAL
ncbi:MAG TPA: MFS transporter, partial [Sphingobacteriaceae bacterium]